MIIKRGSANTGTLADGFYPGIIQRVEVKNEKSRFSMVEERVVLNLSIQVDSPVGPVMLCSQVTANLAPKSKLTQLLEDMGMLPEVA